MAEQFKVEEGHVAGFAVMTSEVQRQLLDVMSHIRFEAAPTQGYNGLMELLAPAVQTYCDETYDRLLPYSSVMVDMGPELNKAAWIFHTTDKSAYTRFVDEGPPLHQRVPVIKDFPSPVHYSPGTPPSLDPPGHSDPPIQDLIDEVGGSINAIDWVISHVAQWSPVEAIVEPLAGNWTELERADEVLTQAGDGFEQVARNLTTQLGRLSAHWQGGAANSFEDYLTRLAAAIEVEGPINRLVGRVLTEVAGEVEGAAEFMVTTLKTAVDKIAKAIATGWIPFVGWYRVYDTAKTVINVFEEAKDLIESINDTIETAKTVIEAAKDPIGFAQGAAEEKLGPLLDAADIAGDLAALDPSAITEAPDDPYSVGSHPRRAG